MSAPALAGVDRPTLSIRGTPYPILLPTLRDPRLHLAAVIVSLQVLGQTAFSFRLSIAQILVALLTSALLEFAIAFRRHRVIMWPASALLTGNGVAFVLRVPGTRHGDWWSLRGAWIFAATAAVALLSKHLIRFHGRHLFNPSNIGLVICFLALGSSRAEPLDFWWGPMSTWMALALAIIVVGGLAILSRLQLLEIAAGFWVSFVAGIGVLALAGHAMTARWHLGPIAGAYFWRILAFSPEVLVFLFFMITDPKTVPSGRTARRVYAIGVGLLAALLIAPQRTEFASKVALLGALAIATALQPVLEHPRVSARLASFPLAGAPRQLLAGAAAVAAVAFAGLLVAAGLPARSTAVTAVQPLPSTAVPAHVSIAASRGVASRLDLPTARLISKSVVADLRAEADALRTRSGARAARAAQGARLDDLLRRIRGAANGPIDVPTYRIERMRVWLEPAEGQGPPLVVAALEGELQLTTYRGVPPMLTERKPAAPFTQTLLLTQSGARYLITGVRGAPGGTAPTTASSPEVIAPTPAVKADFGSVRLANVAGRVGLGFRQGSFRFGISNDPLAMMGGGLCWLDYDNDGWLDLFVVNSYSSGNIGQWEANGGLPRSALYHNVHGRFVDVSHTSGADPAVQGDGCVAADLNGDGRTDLYVTTTSSDLLYWNNGNGTFTEGARAAGIVSFGWRTGAAVADVNGDGRPDLFVAGYTNNNAPIPSSSAGFPTNHQGVRDLLFLNEGERPNGRARFREVGRQVGLDARSEHGLGAIFTDVNGDGRPDLYVANDEDPNRLYLNLPAPGGLGFRLREIARQARVADANAGMGVAVGDFDGDGLPDLFVSNSRGQTHAVFRGTRRGDNPAFANARGSFAEAFGQNFTGWGVSWVDLNRDGNLDLALANGDIPVTNVAKDAGVLQVLDNLAARGRRGRFGSAGSVLGLARKPRVNGRGLAAADFNNDGNVDLAVNTIGGPLLLLENTNTAGHWLEVSVGGFHPGAVVSVTLPGGRTLVRELHAGSSYLSSEDPRAIFGLGSATKVSRVSVRYPGGRQQSIGNVAADRIVVLGP